MKKAVSQITILFIILVLTACNQPANDVETGLDDYVLTESNEAETETSLVHGKDLDGQVQLPGKIAIITTEGAPALSYHTLGGNSLVELIERYGSDNIIIYAWPGRFGNSAKQIDETVEMINEIANNPDIRVLIINPAFHGTDHIVKVLNEQRGDIFVIYLEHRLTSDYVERNSPFQSNTLLDAVSNANLILDFDSSAMAKGFAQKSLELGANTLVYFYDTSILWAWGEEDFEESISRSVDEYERSYLHNLMKEKSEEIGLQFVEVDIAGAIQCGSSYHMFMSETIPQLIENYGTDIVLFGLDNERVFWSWRTHGFIYIPMYPSWFELHPAHLAIELPLVDGSNYLHGAVHGAANLVEEIRKDLDERGLLGRIASLPISPHLLFPLSAAEYSVRWMNGEVSKAGIDTYVLGQIMTEVIEEHTDLQHGVAITTLYEEGVTYENFILVLPDYLIY